MYRIIVVSACAFALSLASIFGQVTSAAIIQFETIAGGNIDGEPVDAMATFTTSLNTITVKLENFQADPNSVKQVLYDILFNVSTGQNAGSITSTTGIERTIVGGGAYTDSSELSFTDWGLFTSGANLHLDRLAAPGAKKHGIIGPPNVGTNEYDNGGGSITGATHNPFWAGAATFVLNVPGVTADSTINAVSFSFNTTPGNDVPAVLVPEPAGMVIALVGLAALIGRHRRRLRSC